MDDSFLFIWSFFIYIFKLQINLKKIKIFLYSFLFLFFYLQLLTLTYQFLKLKNELIILVKKLQKTQAIWNRDFEKEIQFVTGDEWKAGIFLIILNRDQYGRDFQLMRY